MSRKPDVKKMEYFLEFTLEAQLNIDEETNHYKADEDSSDPHVFSSKHEQKMKEIFKLAEKKERMYRTKRRLHKVVAGAAVFLIVSSVVITNVEAFRVPIFNFFTQVKEKSSFFGARNSDNNLKLTKKLADYEPTFVPDGFSVDYVDEADNMYTIQYLNENLGEWYLMTFKKGISSVAIDTENGITEHFEINGREFVRIEKYNDIRVLMYMNGNQYEVIGNIEFDVIVKNLESIE